MRNSIVIKLFSITTVFFTVFLLIVMGFQSFFFDNLYINHKKKSASENLTTFVDNFKSQEEFIPSQVNKLIVNFSLKSNMPLLVTDESGKPLFDNEFKSSSFTVLTDNQKYVDVLLESDSMIFDTPKNLFENNSDFKDPISEYAVGDTVKIKGVKLTIEEDRISPYWISLNGKVIFDISDIPYGYDKPMENIELNGTIAFINEYNLSQDLARNESYILHDYIYSLMDSLSLSDSSDDISEVIKHSFPDYPQITSEKFIDSNSNTENSILKTSLKINGHTYNFLASTSFQPVNEAVEVISKYYPYLFILALAFILIVSLVFSKIVSEPLLELNRVASRMTNLDFTAVSNIKSNDELGNLSKNLNELSRNLNSSLTELKEANSKLKDDIEKEREQEQIRKEFVADVSHELKTPLGVIKGFAEGIKDGIYENKKDYYLDVIVDEIDKMNHMIKEMLELSQFESNAFKIVQSKFYLDRLMNVIREKFRGLEQEKSLIVNTNLSKSLVYADKNKIDQVLVNFYSNALRYTPEHGVINIHISETSDEVIFSIENTSSKFTPENLEKIWNRFYRVDKSRSRSLGGSGLGLSIARNILELHSSRFGVENTETGVKFYFSLIKASQE